MDSGLWGEAASSFLGSNPFLPFTLPVILFFSFLFFPSLCLFTLSFQFISKQFLVKLQMKYTTQLLFSWLDLNIKIVNCGFHPCILFFSPFCIIFLLFSTPAPPHTKFKFLSTLRSLFAGVWNSAGWSSFSYLDSFHDMPTGSLHSHSLYFLCRAI